jgi:DnaK suppressor protein
MMDSTDRMTDDLVKEFRSRLWAARRKLVRTIRMTDDELATLEPRAPGALREDAPTELAAAVLSQLGGREKRELDEIIAAQARLRGGTFGVCEECGRAIPVSRLCAVPAARRCVDCEERHEKRSLS